MPSERIALALPPLSEPPFIAPRVCPLCGAKRRAGIGGSYVCGASYNQRTPCPRPSAAAIVAAMGLVPALRAALGEA